MRTSKAKPFIVSVPKHLTYSAPFMPFKHSKNEISLSEKLDVVNKRLDKIEDLLKAKKR